MPAPASLLKGFARTVANAKPDSKRRQTFGDPDQRGLYLVVTPAGAKSWYVVARDPQRKQVWARLAAVGDMSLENARSAAGEAVRRIKQGGKPFPDAVPLKAPATFKEMAESFLERHVRKQKLRSAGEIERQFKAYVYPKWEAESFVAIRRARVVELLDTIEDDNGPVQADRVLATLRKFFNWCEVRDEDYHSPIVRGMRQTSSKERARKRILTDEEIRLLWAATETGTFGAFLRTALLTAQRRAKVLGMRWEDIAGDVWTIPAEAREKVNAGTLRLPKLALDIIRAQPVIAGNPYVFAGRGAVTIGNLGNDKRALAEVLGIPPWTIHDLRRTAKSLMVRAGVRPDISERTLGHVIQGVEGVYDQHDYATEKAEALEKLAGLVAIVLDPPKGNILPLRKAAGE